MGQIIMKHGTTARLTLGVGLAAMALAGCNKGTPAAPQQTASGTGQPVTAPPIAALPLATAAPSAPALAAPPATALPAATRAIRLTPGRRADRYRYAERAYAMSQAFGESPPDYTVDYQGTRPWIWRADNGGYRVVERLPEGQRVYYYQAGATQPFYVSDPDGGYAYDGDELAGIYSSDGVPLDDVYAAQRADAAARYLDRARALVRAAQYDQRQAAYAADWRARRAAVIQQQQAWDAARDADWQAWHDAHQDDDRRFWQAEQGRRTAYAAAIGAGLGFAAGAALAQRQGTDTRLSRGPQRSGVTPNQILDGPAAAVLPSATGRLASERPQPHQQPPFAPLTPLPMKSQPTGFAAAPSRYVGRQPPPRPDIHAPVPAALAAQRRSEVDTARSHQQLAVRVAAQAGARDVQARAAQIETARFAAQRNAQAARGQHGQFVQAAREEAVAATEARREQAALRHEQHVTVARGQQVEPPAREVPHQGGGAHLPAERQAPPPHAAQSPRAAQPAAPHPHAAPQHPHPEPGRH